MTGALDPMIGWSGIFHILATPFREDGALDVEGLPRLVESALATGVTGLTILGIAGEAHRLTDEERRRVIEIVAKETRGRTPVAVGVSASGTDARKKASCRPLNSSQFKT